MYVYAKELGREIPDISKLSNKERINLKEELSFTYNVKMGYQKYRLRMRAVTDNVRIINCLARRGINFLDEVAELTKSEFISTLGLGINTANIMEKILREHNLSFKKN